MTKEPEFLGTVYPENKNYNPQKQTKAFENLLVQLILYGMLEEKLLNQSEFSYAVQLLQTDF